MVFLFSCDKENSINNGKEDANCQEVSLTDIVDFVWKGSSIKTDTIYDNVTKSISSSYEAVLRLNSDFNYIIQIGKNFEIGKWNLSSSKCELSLKHVDSENVFFNITIRNDSLKMSQKEGNVIKNYLFIKSDQGPIDSSPEIPVDWGNNDNETTCGIDINKLTKKWYNTKTLIEYTNSDGRVTSSGWIYPVGFFEVKVNKDYHVYSNGVTRLGIWELNENTCQLVLDKNRELERYFDVLKLTSDSLVIRKHVGTYEINTQYYVLR